MKLQQLRDFITVASTGSLRAAARQLNVTQPAVTKSIQLLEKEIGCSLFDRAARGVSLNGAGRSFLPRAQAALNELLRGVQEIKTLNGEKGSVNIGISAAISLTSLGDALKDFRKSFSDVNVRLISGAFSVMFTELRAGALDFSIGPRPPEALGGEFSVEHLFTNSRAVVCRRGHPLGDSTSLLDLINAEWLVSGVMGLPAVEHDQIFLNLGIPVPHTVIQCEYPTALLALLAETDMISFLPKQYAADSSFLRHVLMEVPVREELPRTDILLIKKSGIPLTPMAEYLLTVIKRHIHYDAL
ncbi:DNA-binding transcriptional regulator, LysR family [Variovorax sp. PDC80]|uniref:LysR substrate-binding domain-containing protein n=1 Tax=Variovorax sp. PDC80 TaxID=1882827 RepID=UPI0008EB6B74|nr:LysR substrate-binding domain-containing protein [Variovorax sp. PDC80]SFN99030.1 DNA-binding transcriptional regulator, LysR family [Variovorax sp. PDC80]